MHRARWMGAAAAAALLVAAAARPVAGHALGAECKLKDDRVEVEAYYDDDTAAGNARVVVRDATDRIVAEGRTDARGRWSFPRPAPGKYRVRVDAGAGHQTRLTITIADSTAPPPTANNDPAPEPDEGGIVSEGPGRTEFTRTPWLQVGIGLSAIAALAAGWWGARQLLRPSAGPSGNGGRP